MDESFADPILIVMPVPVWSGIAESMDRLAAEAQSATVTEDIVASEVNGSGVRTLVLRWTHRGVDPERIVDALALAMHDQTTAAIRSIHNESTDYISLHLVITPSAHADEAILRAAVVTTINEVRQVTIAMATKIRDNGNNQVPAAVDDGGEQLASICLDAAQWEFVLEDASRRADPMGLGEEPEPGSTDALILDLIAAQLRLPLDEVMTGELETGERWVIEAGGGDDDYLTMLTVLRGDRIVSSGGMGGPKLLGSLLMSVSYGQCDNERYTETIRVDANVERVVITTRRGVEVVATLSEPFDDVGLRFGAAILPEGEVPARIRAEIGGEIVETQVQ